MIQLESINFSYPNQPPIFQDFSWEVQEGETWAVLGPSGCGKTTLLYLVAGLLFPQAGQVRVGGEALTRPRPHSGLIIQEYGLLPWATVRENARLGLRLREFYGPDGVHSPPDFTPGLDVSPWLERLGILHLAEKYPRQISGGERQRTAIARTLTLEPDLLLMDEPFSSLDAPTRESLQNLTLELQAEQNLTLVIVTHTIEEAVILGKQILLLGDPPNVRPRVIPNPRSGDPRYRDSDAYRALCRQLRAHMEGEKVA
ncbi:MAG: Bicarbonate transport ATP-binding protein CmpD [Chloroflexi bacterium]|nr:Bicarbonate transport ATP-binding protein CmpD [Chloroflexota bacterium]